MQKLDDNGTRVKCCKLIDNSNRVTDQNRVMFSYESVLVILHASFCNEYEDFNGHKEAL